MSSFPLLSKKVCSCLPRRPTVSGLHSCNIQDHSCDDFRQSWPAHHPPTGAHYSVSYSIRPVRLTFNVLTALHRWYPNRYSICSENSLSTNLMQYLSNTQKQNVHTIALETNVNDYLCFGVITVNSSSIVIIAQCVTEVSSNLSNNCHLDMCQFCCYCGTKSRGKLQFLSPLQ